MKWFVVAAHQPPTISAKASLALVVHRNVVNHQECNRSYYYIIIEYKMSKWGCNRKLSAWGELSVVIMSVELHVSSNPSLSLQVTLASQLNCFLKRKE